MQKFPVITLLMKHGNLFAIAVAVAVVLLGAYGAYAGGGPIWLAGGLVAGGVTYVLLKSYVELVAILSDMLMPR